MDQLTNGNFVAGELYKFNLIINGQVVEIECTFTGSGETVAGEECGHFYNSKTGHTFKWTKVAAIASMPVAWAESKAEF